MERFRSRLDELPDPRQSRTMISLCDTARRSAWLCRPRVDSGRTVGNADVVRSIREKYGSRAPGGGINLESLAGSLSAKRSAAGVP